MKNLHARLGRFARSRFHRQYLLAAYAHSFQQAGALGGDASSGARPRGLLCGTGSPQTTATWLEHLLRAHGTVRPLVLDLCAEPLQASIASGAKATFVRADALDLPLAAGSIDLIESDFFLQYFDGTGKRRIVREWARVLSSRGVITTRDYIPRAGSMVDASLDRLRIRVLRFFLGQTFHTTSQAELVSIFAEHGLEASLSSFRIAGCALPLVQSVTARWARGSHA